MQIASMKGEVSVYHLTSFSKEDTKRVYVLYLNRRTLMIDATITPRSSMSTPKLPTRQYQLTRLIRIQCTGS